MVDRETRKQLESQERFFAELMQVEANAVCADCGTPGPKWASWNIGVFLCIRCCGVHRSLGTHISKVKALSLDKWTPEQMENIQLKGNYKVNLLYNPRNICCPNVTNDKELERFIRDKYDRKLFMDPIQKKKNIISTVLPYKENIAKYSSEISRLVNMGFGDVEVNCKALEISGGNIQEAVDYLIDHPTDIIKQEKLTIIHHNNQSDYKFDLDSPKVQKIISMGFTDSDAVINALETSDGSVEEALEILTSENSNQNGDSVAQSKAKAVSKSKYAIENLLCDIGTDPFAATEDLDYDMPNPALSQFHTAQVAAPTSYNNNKDLSISELQNYHQQQNSITIQESTIRGFTQTTQVVPTIVQQQPLAYHQPQHHAQIYYQQQQQQQQPQIYQQQQQPQVYQQQQQQQPQVYQQQQKQPHIYEQQQQQSQIYQQQQQKQQVYQQQVQQLQPQIYYQQQQKIAQVYQQQQQYQIHQTLQHHNQEVVGVVGNRGVQPNYNCQINTNPVQYRLPPIDTVPQNNQISNDPFSQFANISTKNQENTQVSSGSFSNTFVSSPTQPTSQIHYNNPFQQTNPSVLPNNFHPFNENNNKPNNSYNPWSNNK